MQINQQNFLRTTKLNRKTIMLEQKSIRNRKIFNRLSLMSIMHRLLNSMKKDNTFQNYSRNAMQMRQMFNLEQIYKRPQDSKRPFKLNQNSIKQRLRMKKNHMLQRHRCQMLKEFNYRIYWKKLIKSISSYNKEQITIHKKQKN